MKVELALNVIMALLVVASYWKLGVSKAYFYLSTAAYVASMFIASDFGDYWDSIHKSRV